MAERTPEQQEAIRTYQREYAKRRRAEQRAAGIPPKPKTAEQKARHRELSLESYHRLKKDPEWLERKRRWGHAYWLKKYGVTQEWYEQTLAEQQGCCAICGSDKHMKGRAKLYVDHDHETNEVRSILCAHCNFGLGSFQDNPDLLEAAASYLRAHRRRRLRLVS